MSELKPEKIDLSQINSGNKYKNGDVVDANAINSAVQASAYAQALATNQPNLENADKYGEPKVSIEEVGGLPRFKFENIKGTRDSQIVKNQNNISAIFSVLQNKQITQVAEDVPNNKAFRQTAEYSYYDEELGDDVTGALNVVDGSYTKVTKIEGKGTLLGIKSINANLLPTKDEFINKGFTLTNKGLTMEITDNGIHIYGTTLSATRVNFINTQMPMFVPSGTYYFSASDSNGGRYTYEMAFAPFDNVNTEQVADIRSRTNTPSVVNLPNGCIRAYFNIAIFAESMAVGTHIDTWFKPMLNYSQELLPFEWRKESIMTLPTPLNLGDFQEWKDGKIYDYNGNASVDINWQVELTDESFDDETGEFVGGNNVTLFASTNFSLPDDIDLTVANPVDTVVNITLKEEIETGTSSIDFSLRILYSVEENKFYMTPLYPYFATNLVDQLSNSWTITYKTLTPQSVADFTFDNEYQVWNGGSEQMLLEGEDVPTIYNEYLIYFGEEEGGDK